MKSSPESHTVHALSSLHALVQDWHEVTPDLLRSFYTEVTSSRPLYDYGRLFADHWIGSIATQQERCLATEYLLTYSLTYLLTCLLTTQQERCLATERAAAAPRFVYDYNRHGGWHAMDGTPPDELPGPAGRTING